MRLTLRTLLAYRDGVLSQADYEDLHRRIQQSPDAGNLLRRINELTTSSNVPTPKLDVAGLGGTNVIAEYLDDVLTSTRIAELERLCLEYSEHLCELAHCHQLLAQAMHTHVEVSEELQQKALAIIDPAKRDQIRSQLLTQSRKVPKTLIAEVVEPVTNILPITASVAVPVGVSQPTADAPPVATVASSPQQVGLSLEGTSLTTEVPEYLLGSRKRRWQIPAAILALAALLVYMVWLSIGGSLDNVKQMLMADGSGQVGKDKLAQNDQEKKSDTSNESNSKHSDISKAGTAADSKSATSNATTTENESATESEAGRSGTKRPVNADNPAGAEKSDTAKSEEEGASNPSTSTDSVSNPVEPLSDLLKDNAKPNEAALPKKIVWSPLDEQEANSVVLVTNDEGSMLAEPAREIGEGRFIVPPAARTTIQAGPIRLLSIGPSMMVLNAEADSPKLISSLCRALVSTSVPGKSFTLQSPCGTYVIEILDKSVWLGLEIGYRPINKGSVVEPDCYAPVMILVVGLDAPTESTELLRVVRSDNEQVVKVTSQGQGIAVVKQNQMESFALQSPPMWYRKRSVRAIDQLGMADFSKALQASTEPLTDKLRELATDSRPEVAALAIQTAMLRGDWQPFAAELLSNDRMRVHWQTSLDLARQLLASKPELKQELQTELNSKLGPDAERVGELIGGLSSSNQSSDGLLGLVKTLDGANGLPVRILAAYELKQLTGEDYGYQPHAPVRATIQQLRSRIVQNKLSFLPINDPIYERNGR